MIEKTRKRRGGTHESHKDVSIGLLTSVVSSLIVQRSLAGALRDTLGDEHPTAIGEWDAIFVAESSQDTLVKEWQTLASFLRHRTTKSGLSDKDVHQLSRVHKHSSHCRFPGYNTDGRLTF